MFKLIIADDESKVCRLIRRLIECEELGIEIIGTANSGIDALDLICQHNPDIVITDIRMPGLDGLEVIKSVKERGLDPKFIIISGYRQFEYAQNALRYNVEDYLLKPIKKNELNGTLKKICSNLSDDNRKIRKERDIYDKLMNNRSNLRKHFTDDIIQKQDSFLQKDIEFINNEYQLSFQPGIFQSAFIKIDSRNNAEPTPGKEKILIKICEICEKVLGETCCELLTSTTSSGVLCIINYSENDEEQIKKSEKLLYEQIRSYLDFFEHFNITIGIGSSEKDISNLSKTVQSSLDAVKCRVVLGVDRIILSRNLKYDDIASSVILDSEKERQLENISEILDAESLKSWLQDISDTFKSNPHINPGKVFDICERIGEIIIGSMRRLGGNPELENVFQRTMSLSLEDAKSIDEVFNHLNDTAATYFHDQLQEKRMRDNKPIRIAKQFISDNYMEQIRLDEVAELVHFNPTYFSTVFKKETGMTLKDYLINHRLEVAKELLKSTNMSVGDIAKEIGYLETKYFTKMFKKIIGIKPSEYRKLYS